MNKDDGGPAFPVTPDNCPTTTGMIERPSTGMTLRDWFAGQALAGLMAYPHSNDTWADAAKRAWIMADAMLAARKDDK